MIELFARTVGGLARDALDGIGSSVAVWYFHHRRRVRDRMRSHFGVHVPCMLRDLPAEFGGERTNSR